MVFFNRSRFTTTVLQIVFTLSNNLGQKKNNAVKVTQNIENLEALRKREKKWRKYLNVILSLSPFTLTEVDMNLTNQTGFLTVVQSALSLRLCTLNQYSLGKQQILFSRQFCFSESQCYPSGHVLLISILSVNSKSCFPISLFFRESQCYPSSYVNWINIPPVNSKFCFLVSFFFRESQCFPQWSWGKQWDCFPWNQTLSALSHMQRTNKANKPKQGGLSLFTTEQCNFTSGKHC